MPKVPPVSTAPSLRPRGPTSAAPRQDFALGTDAEVKQPLWAQEPTRAAPMDVAAAFASSAHSDWDDGPTTAFANPGSDGLADATTEMSKGELRRFLSSIEGTVDDNIESDAQDKSDFDVEETSPETLRARQALGQKASNHVEPALDDILDQLAPQNDFEGRQPTLSPSLHRPMKRSARDEPEAAPDNLASVLEPTLDPFKKHPAAKATRRTPVAQPLAGLLLAGAAFLLALIGLRYTSLPSELAPFDYAVVAAAAGIMSALLQALVGGRTFWLLILATAGAAGAAQFTGYAAQVPMPQWIAAVLVLGGLGLRLAMPSRRQPS